VGGIIQQRKTLTVAGDEVAAALLGALAVVTDRGRFAGAARATTSVGPTLRIGTVRHTRPGIDGQTTIRRCAVGERPSAVGERPSAVGERPSAVGEPSSAVAERSAGVDHRPVGHQPIQDDAPAVAAVRVTCHEQQTPDPQNPPKRQAHV
jgi:hypothetical protein